MGSLNLVDKNERFISLLFLSALIFCFSHTGYAQDSENSSSGSLPADFLIKLKPEIGLGAGMMSFKGDLGYKKIEQSFRHRVGKNISGKIALNEFLDLEGNVTWGKLFGNEPDSATPMNFESRIMAAGTGLTYNFFTPFYNKSAKSPIITPYLGTGFELIRFSSFSDTKDKDGKVYHYWSDGKLRDLPELKSNIPLAQEIYRDYIYETENVSPTMTFGIPVNAGIRFNIYKGFSATIGTSYHLTFTDKIDNVTAKGNDKFLYSGVTVRYAFGEKGKPDPEELLYQDVNFSAFDYDDSDADGVPDFKDGCPDTPLGIPVDANGCPLDDDDDGVPNYLDKESNTARGSVVDEYGITINDEYIAKKLELEERNRSTRVVREITYSPLEEVAYEVVNIKSPEGISFSVLLGSYREGIPMNMIEAFMNISDLRSRKADDGKTEYLAGTYGSLSGAESRQKEIEASGLQNTSLIAFDKSGKKVDASAYRTTEKVKLEVSGTTTYDLIFKVQLGAFKKQLSPDYFEGIEVVTKEEAPGGLTRYFAGSFSSYDRASVYRDQMIEKGFTGAYVVAFKGGSRISIKRETPEPERIVKKPETTEKEINIRFRVQLGLFKGEVPASASNLMSGIKNIDILDAADGGKRYVSGSFKSYEEAKSHKELMQSRGFSDAFIIAFRNNSMISVKEAVNSLK